VPPLGVHGAVAIAGGVHHEPGAGDAKAGEFGGDLGGVGVDAVSGVSIDSFVSDQPSTSLTASVRSVAFGADSSARMGILVAAATFFNQRILVMPRRMKLC